MGSKKFSASSLVPALTMLEVFASIWTSLKVSSSSSGEVTNIWFDQTSPVRSKTVVPIDTQRLACSTYGLVEPGASKTEGLLAKSAARIRERWTRTDGWVVRSILFGKAIGPNQSTRQKPGPWGKAAIRRSWALKSLRLPQPIHVPGRTHGNLELFPKQRKARMA